VAGLFGLFVHQFKLYVIVYSTRFRLATRLVVHTIGVEKSKSIQFNVHPLNSYHVLVGSGIGFVAVDQYSTF
jgi:hypothetical protein